MNKHIKVEKKKAQYENRIRALESYNHELRTRMTDMQKLVHEQHALINIQDAQIKAFSTTHTPYQQPDTQTQTLQQSLIGTETNPELTDQALEILAEQPGLLSLLGNKAPPVSPTQ